MHLDQLVREHFSDVSVNKELSRRYGASDRAIPDYVSDWLVTRYTTPKGVDEEKIRSFLARHLPDKKHKNAVLNDLMTGGEIKILDAYSVRVDIANNRRLLEIPCLDISNAAIDDTIIDETPFSFTGMCGEAGRLNTCCARIRASSMRSA